MKHTQAILDVTREGWQGLMAHRTRSLLSTTGILFGIAAVIGILSIGEGARAEQERLIDQMGIQNFQIRDVPFDDDDEEALQEVRRLSQGLSRIDVAALRAELPGARHVGGLRSLDISEFLPRPRRPEAVAVVGADPDYLAGTQLSLAVGRPLNTYDESHKAPVALLGRQAAINLFAAEPVIGRRIRLGSVWLTVVGVFHEPSLGGVSKFEGVDIRNREDDIIIPLSTSLARFPKEPLVSELDEIQVALTGTELVEGHTQLAARVIDRLHHQQEDTRLVVPLRLLEQARAQQRIFNLVMGLIAGISLLVGGIGIMNIMLASVLERTREIGIRLAVGARPKDIRLLFLSEAACISLIGGVAGIAAGFGIAAAVAAFTGWETAVSPQVVGLATLISMVEGIVFGFLPAQRAAGLPPVIAVRQVG